MEDETRDGAERGLPHVSQSGVNAPGVGRRQYCTGLVVAASALRDDANAASERPSLDSLCSGAVCSSVS